MTTLLDSTARYSLRLSIDSSLFDDHPSDNLCIARKVNGLYTTIFLGASVNPTGFQEQLQVENEFSWYDQYQVYCVKDFKPSVVVSAATNTVNIQYGEETSYVSNRMSAARSTDTNNFQGGAIGENSAEDSFMVFKIPSHLKAACACKREDGRYDPIYVDPGHHLTANDDQITPSRDFVIFWSDTLVPNAMFHHYKERSGMKEFSFAEGVTKMSLRFGFANASTRAGNEEAQFWVI